VDTGRLSLRGWRKGDEEGFARMNSDVEVMEYYPRTLSGEESDALAVRFDSLIKKNGWGFWAVELKREEKFIGFIGLNRPTYDLPVKPCVEIGWRLAKEYWGKGYATEGAKMALKFAFQELELNRVYSFTPVLNQRSQAVMERIGMKNVSQNFMHPLVPAHSPLSEHVLYEISKKEYSAKEASS